jgi:hypothetical protein
MQVTRRLIGGGYVGNLLFILSSFVYQLAIIDR